MKYKILVFGKLFIELISKGIQTVISLIRILLISRPTKNLPVNKNKYCSILGNGPSLNASIEEESVFIQTTDMVCVNTFASTEYYERLKPTDYVLIDPLFFSEEGRKRDIITNTFLSIIEKTNWEMNMYVPINYKNSYFLNQLITFKKNINLVYFNYTIFEGFDCVKYKFFEWGLATPQSQNVMVASLFLMLNRKFETIFLFGADHSWHEQIVLTEDNQTAYRDLHFYDKNELKFQIVDANKNKTASMSNQFISLAKAFYGYEVLKKYAVYKKINVLNASKRSYIDAFDRIKISNLTHQ